MCDPRELREMERCEEEKIFEDKGQKVGDLVTLTITDSKGRPAAAEKDQIRSRPVVVLRRHSDKQKEVQHKIKTSMKWFRDHQKLMIRAFRENLKKQDDQFESESESLSIALKERKNDDERKSMMSCCKVTTSKLEEKWLLERKELMKKLEEKDAIVTEYSVILDEKAQLLEENKRLQFEVKDNSENIKKREMEFSEHLRLLELSKKEVATLQAEKIAAKSLGKSEMDKMRCGIKWLKNVVKEQTAVIDVLAVTLEEKSCLLKENGRLQSLVNECFKHLEKQKSDISEAKKVEADILNKKKKMRLVIAGLKKTIEEQNAAIAQHSVTFEENARHIAETEKLQSEVDQLNKILEIGVAEKAMLDKSEMDRMRWEMEGLKKTVEEKDTAIALHSVTLEEKSRLWEENEELYSVVYECLKHLQMQSVDVRKAGEAEAAAEVKAKKMLCDIQSLKKTVKEQNSAIAQHSATFEENVHLLGEAERLQSEVDELKKRLEIFEAEKDEKNNWSLRTDGVSDEIVTFLNNVVHVRLSTEEDDAVVEAATADAVAEAATADAVVEAATAEAEIKKEAQ